MSDIDLRAVGLPVSVKEVVGRRLVAASGPDTERVLALAAVIGRDFDVPLLAAVAQVDEDDAGRPVRRRASPPPSCRRRITPTATRSPTPSSSTPSTTALSPARRSRAHRAVAEQLEAMRGGDPERAARRAGASLGRRRAAHRHRQRPSTTRRSPAARALDQLAPDEALRWYEQALELPRPRAGRRPPSNGREILIGLGDAQKQCGVPAYRETLIEAAHLADRIGDVDLLARAALRPTTAAFESLIGDVDADRLAVIDLALERITDPDSPERARLLALSVPWSRSTCSASMIDWPSPTRRSPPPGAREARSPSSRR